MVVGKLNTHMKKNEVGPLVYTTYRNELKMNYRHKCKHLKLIEENIEEKKLHDTEFGRFLEYDTKSKKHRQQM